MRNFSKSNFNQGSFFRHLSFEKYNGSQFASGTAPLSGLGKYLNDVEAALNGVPVGGDYKLKAGNPYGMREGTTVERLV